MKNQQQTRSSTGSHSNHSQKISDSFKKKFWLREIFFLVYHVVRLALSITIIVILSGTDFSQIKNSKGYLRTQQILQIWGKNVIVDIITVSTYNCPKGYEPYTSASWPGTKEGCLCSTTLNQYDYVHVIPGQCSLKLINVGCTKINPQKSIPFVFWKMDKLICVKRINGLNFYTNLSNQVPNLVLHYCSNNTPYKFQSLSPVDCPMTQISNQSQVFPYKLYDINFSFARENSYPIVDIKMSEYSFCLQYNKSNISPNRFQNYDLQVIQIQNCLEDGDPRVKIIDKITEKALFNSNQRILDVITNILPIYPAPTDLYFYLLGTVQYPPWTFQCRQSDQYNLSKVKNVFQLSEGIEKSQTCIYLGAALISIWGFLYFLLSAIKKILQLRSRHKNGILFYPDSLVLQISPNSLPNQLKLSLCCQLIVFTFLLGLMLGLLIQIGVQYAYANSLQQWFRQSFTCMDGSIYFQQWVTDGYLSHFQTFIRQYLICLLAGIVGACVDIVYLVWRCHKGDLQSQHVAQLFQLNDKEDKNSDEKLSDRKNNQILQFEDINEKEEPIEEDQADNAFKNRQKTGDFQLYDFENLDQKQMKSQRLKHRTFNRRNTLGMTRPAQEANNPTEQSFVAMEQDDIVFKRTIMKDNDFKNRRQKKIKDKTKIRNRLQSLELDQ